MRPANPLCALFALTLAASAGAQESGPEVVQMGTGSLAAVYFPVGVALCRLVNQDRRNHGIRCAARPSAGSIDNLRGLRDGDYELALVQSDAQEAALSGTGLLADAGPFDDLRAVMSLYPEPLTIVARPDAGIAGLDDLPGKRVSIGPAGSGQRILLAAVGDALGWAEDALVDEPELRSSAVAQSLCSGEIDAFVLVVGHPAPVVQEATRSCNAVLVDVAGSEVTELVAADPQYVTATIPAGTYAGQEVDVETFGVGATMVSRADVADEVIVTLVRSVFGELDMLRGLNPVLVNLDPEAMASTGLSTPLHPAAQVFYREQGWLN